MFSHKTEGQGCANGPRLTGKEKADRKGRVRLQDILRISREDVTEVD